MAATSDSQGTTPSAHCSGLGAESLAPVGGPSGPHPPSQDPMQGSQNTPPHFAARQPPASWNSVCKRNTGKGSPEFTHVLHTQSHRDSPGPLASPLNILAAGNPPRGPCPRAGGGAPRGAPAKEKHLDSNKGSFFCRRLSPPWTLGQAEASAACSTTFRVYLLPPQPRAPSS